MKRVWMMVILAAALMLGACQSQETEVAENAAPDEEQALLEKSDPAGTYGSGLTEAEMVSIDQLLASPMQYEGKKVQVSGVVKDVCEMRGCWMEVASADGGQFVKVKVKDGEIVFPLSAKGHKAVAEGVVKRIDMDQKQAVKYLSHIAQENNETFDSTSVTGPMTFWQIAGSGARIEGE